MPSAPVVPSARRLRLLAFVTALATALGAVTAMPSLADLADVADDLVAHYPFDETSGTTVADVSGNGNDAQIVDDAGGAVTWQGGAGLRLPGGISFNGSTSAAVQLPDALLTGLDQVTITYDVLATGPNGGTVFTFGRGTDGGHLAAATGNTNNTTTHQASIAGPGTPAQVARAPGGLARDTWKHVAVTVDGGDATTPGTMRLYEDGQEVATNDALAVAPGDITSAASFIGRPTETSGFQRLFEGTIKDFRIYSTVLDQSEVAELSTSLAAANLQDLLGRVSLGDTSAVVDHLDLPSMPGLTWTTSDPDVVTATGRITRPAADDGDATATLTATVTHRGLTDSVDFDITVSARVVYTDEELRAGLVHQYLLDETSGTVLADSGSAGEDATLVNPDKAELTGTGVRFNPDSYESALSGGYVDLPDDLTAGMTALTVDYDVWIDPANVGNHQMWSLGSKSGSCDADAGQQGVIFASNTQRFRIAVGNANVQQNRVRLLEGVWKHVTYTQEPNADGTTWTGTLYLDGVRHASVGNLTTPPSVNPTAGTNCNFLARSQVAGDYSFRGTLSDFRVYDRAVDLDEALALAQDTVQQGVVDDAEAIDLGLTSAIVRDIVLPEVGDVAGSDITWTSSDPSVVEVSTPPASATKVPVTGVVTRPAAGQPDATVTLTATVRKGAFAVTTRPIEVTVKAAFTDAEAVDRDTYDLVVDNTEDVRGNLALADSGEFGSTITWSSTTDLVSPTGEVQRPAYGHPEVTGTVTATVSKGGASQTRSFDITIRPLPREEEKQRYFLGYFKGENLPDGEQIMFATSNGNTALDWTGLTGGRPSLISQLGDQGLRDPHITRSPDGDTFSMIATNLNWYDQGGYAINDTQHIEVFESHDLVNWSPQRHVKVAPDDAGNAFAPESQWVSEIGAYAVFWAQSLWNDPINRTGQGNAQMWYNITRDFRTFSEPRVWQDPAPESRIDTTAIKVGDTYYRVTKNEAGNAGSDLFMEKNTDFLDSDLDAWTMVAPALGRTTWDANQGYEGPVIFEANPGDTACPDQYYLWGDRYTNGGGYQAACSADIEAPTWDARAITMTNAGVARPRHGTVLPITLREWNTIRGIPNDDVATTTELTVAETVEAGATATATVTAADTFETGGEVVFSLGSWSESAFITDGVAEVALPDDLPAGTQTITASYLGFDILEPSQDSATVEVVGQADTTPPTLQVDGIVDGQTYVQGAGDEVTWSATDDESGVRIIRVRLDGTIIDRDLPLGGPFVPGSLEPGTYELFVRAHDVAGNAVTQRFVFTVVAPPDTTRPTVAVTGVRDGATLGDSRVLDVTVTAGDDGSGLEVLRVWLDDHRIHTGGSPHHLELGLWDLDLGEHTIRAVARDAAGNRRGVRVTFTVGTSTQDVLINLDRFTDAGLVQPDVGDRVARLVARAQVLDERGKTAQARSQLQKARDAARDIDSYDVVRIMVRDINELLADLDGRGRAADTSAAAATAMRKADRGPAMVETPEALRRGN